MIRYNPKGLTTPQIDESRRRHGDNVITPPKDDSAWRLLLEKFRDPIIRILLLAAVLSLIIGFVHKDFTESVGIICAIILATCVGFWFEWDAQRRFRRLNQVNDDIPVKVMRDGSIREIPAPRRGHGRRGLHRERRDDSRRRRTGRGRVAENQRIDAHRRTRGGQDGRRSRLRSRGDLSLERRCCAGTTVADGYGVMVVTAVGDATGGRARHGSSRPCRAKNRHPSTVS